MIFVTVGTQFAFDRLVKAIDDFVSYNGFKQEVFAQIGNSSYKPRSFEYVKSLNKSGFDYTMKKASSIISHAGMGTITTALDNHKPLLVMPRIRKYGEVVNNHQVAIARNFEKLGCILVAYETEELPVKIEELKTFVPRKREAQTQMVAERIARFLSKLANNGK